MGRLQGGDVNHVIADRAVNGDGIEIKAGLGEVTYNLDRITGYVAAGRTGWRRNAQRADNDFLDIVELGHDCTVAGHHDFGRGEQYQRRISRQCCCSGVDHESFRRRGVIVDREGIDPGTAINVVTSASGTRLVDEVRTVTGQDNIVASSSIDCVDTAKAQDDVARRSPGQGVGRSSPGHDRVGRGTKAQRFSRRDGIGAFSACAVGCNDRPGSFADSEVGDRPGEDRRIGPGPANDRVIAGPASQLVVTIAPIQAVVASPAVHGVRTAQERRKVNTKCDVIASGTVEGGLKQRDCTDEVVTNDPGRLRNHGFSSAEAIGEARHNPQDAANLGLRRGKAGCRCPGDAGPCGAAVG